MKKIAVATATRAEYGLLAPVIKELRRQECGELRIELIVTGTHLSEKYGMTICEIDDRIDHRISVSVKSTTESDISANQAEVLMKFTTLFIKEKYDAIVLLGDRYEILAIAIAAGNTRIPVFHLCGGDTTEGAQDEWIRHSITKISYLHFVTNEISRKRVVQLGEDPSRVFNFGSTSIDNILKADYMSKEEALKSIGLGDCKYAVCTYHPVTMECDSAEDQVTSLLETIRMFSEIQFIVTKSNADKGGARINEILDEAERKIGNLHVYSSLGVRRYLSFMKYSEFVIGNSSSGIIESPILHVPTVNIGDRQRGRLQSESVINCETDRDSIALAIHKALSEEHKAVCKTVVSPYGSGNAAEQIAAKSVEIVKNGKIDLKKSFYEI
ncbi:MAG: UDP-N-acetylglucosamine 2-epimerase (hydrolyzing) [Lachnospiraceae bacterium]|nr:UDP-N-acetylglucosamine 2-epimerase (hydrolyzing) [Lachnospiraceae bacterium]